jgi:hypothetical protein
MDMYLANVLTTLVMMEKNAPLILATRPPENAPTNMLSVLIAHLKDNALRTSTAKLGLSRMIMIWNASPQFVTMILVHAKLYQMEENAELEHAKKHAQPLMLAKNHLALMISNLNNLFALSIEKSVTTKTDVLKILVTRPPDVYSLLTRPLKDVIPLFAKIKLIVLNGQLITILQINAKMQSVMIAPKLAELFWSTTKTATHAWINARRDADLPMLVKPLNVLQILPPKNAAV